MKTLADPRIKQFCDLVNRGIESWVAAGKLLTELVRDNPAVYTDILSGNPHLTRDILDSFERVGRKQIYPYLLVDGSPGSRRLVSLPYKDQVKLFCSRVAVIVKIRGGFEERLKRVSELSSPEAALVFDVDRVRPTNEQMSILRNARKSLVVHSSPGPSSPVEPAASLKGDPKSELARQLTIANDAMIEARTQLAMVKLNSRKDVHITNALIEIGSLRYAVNEDEL